MVTEIASPGLGGVLSFASRRHLTTPHSMAQLDGSDGGASLRVEAVGWSVRNVVQEPSGICNATHFRRGSLIAQEIRSTVQIEEDADSAGAAARQHQLGSVGQSLD